MTAALSPAEASALAAYAREEGVCWRSRLVLAAAEGRIEGPLRDAHRKLTPRGVMLYAKEASE